MIKISRNAVLKAKKYTNEAYLNLAANNKKLNDNISRELTNLRDVPSTEKYAEMMSQIESLMNQLRNNFNDIDEFCDEMIKWIDKYNEY